VAIACGALAVTPPVGPARAGPPTPDQPQEPVVVAAQPAPRAAESGAGPHCSDQPYAPDKKLGRNEPPRERRPAATDPVGDDVAENDGRILTRDQGLSVPAEIRRIRRGYVESFLGAFINDGLAHWDGVDLDRNLVVVVQRRIHDERAAMPRSFDDPSLPPRRHAGLIFGRKFASGRRTELEVVSILTIDPAALEAFVCVANAAWAAVPAPPAMTSDGSLDRELLDERQQGASLLSYRKRVDSRALDEVLQNSVERYLPRATWN
jgi:hypothetical protein